MKHLATVRDREQIISLMATLRDEREELSKFERREIADTLQRLLWEAEDWRSAALWQPDGRPNGFRSGQLKHCRKIYIDRDWKA